MDHTTANSNIPQEPITPETMKTDLKEVDEMCSVIRYQLEWIVDFIVRKWMVMTTQRVFSC